MGRIIRGNQSRKETPEQLQSRLRQTLRQNLGYEKTDDMPSEYLMEVPPWFVKNNCDISIIVPMFKSKHFIEEQIASWEDDDLTAEIIYVDDLCPQASYASIIPSWEKKNKHPVGKIILSNIHRGYAGNCNLGAKYASGEHLVFLNADVVVQKNWLCSMYNLFKNEQNVGIVGNLQIQRRSTDESIDSAGSEWGEEVGEFEHIGRKIYNGMRLTRPIPLADAPIDLLCVAEREMVTGCCFMIPKSLFNEIGGYDTNYKIGYWEDSDMNMKVHSVGKRVLFQPESRVYHFGGHSNCYGHKYMRQNKRLFYERWVNTGFVETLRKEIKEINGGT